ncbi:hypothetical protein SAMN06265379_102290 [Saccharicrinis carchari]|uniref:Uncharacterized protein n=1 Tax=Saccharicrinis carchari TaxID=1168039 RepID=A0A521C102_SACCC|nr:hypothetical protein SAMN06265379_102290 [Saccharicrinis carchari]
MLGYKRGVSKIRSKNRSLNGDTIPKLKAHWPISTNVLI